MAVEPRRIRFLFTMFQGGGNIPLIMPIVSRMVERGHEVRLLAGPGIRPNRAPINAGFLERIQQSGATRVPFQEPSPNPFDTAPPLRGLVFDWLPGRFRSIAATEARTTVWSHSWAQNAAKEIRDNPPAVLVSDFLLLGTLVAAEAAKLPSAAIVHNAFPPSGAGQPPKGSGLSPPNNPWQALKQQAWKAALDRNWIRNGLPAFNSTRSELGLQPLRSQFEQYGRVDRMLVLGHQAFDFPSRRPPVNMHYVGTPIDDANVGQDTWKSPWPAEDSRPIILVSLSTLSQGQTPVMHRILDALGGMPVRAIVTLGPSLKKEDFRPPENAVLEQFVPHSAVLPHVSAMVTQCGLGSFTKALIHGIPLVCLPLLGDQPDNAARIGSHGAGIVLKRDASAVQIRSAIARVLNQPQFRQSAQRLAALMQGEPAEDRAAADLESLAASGRA